jgi:hypothetical protein
MTENNISNEEINPSDDEYKRESFNSIRTEENSSDENPNEEAEELDFYDFLEVVSDKIDNITTQSKK